MFKHRATRTIHGETKSPLWRVWSGLMSRCLYQGNTAYRYYGGKGIKVCKQWMKYTAFKTWAVANGYERGLSIDRIDAGGNYTPSNCRWITREENSRRASASVYVTAHGETKTAGQWLLDPRCKAKTESTIRMRVKRGVTGEEALAESRIYPKQERKITSRQIRNLIRELDQGETITRLTAKYGISRSTIYRIKLDAAN